MVSSRFSFRIFTLFFYYLYFFCHFYTYSSLSTSFHRLHKFRLWNMNLHHLKNIFLLFILLFVICYPMYCANELVYLLKLLGYYLISDCWWHTQRTKKKIQNLANHIPAGLWKLCLLWKCVFLMSSEIFWLRNPTMLCLILKFRLGQLDTWMSWLLALKLGGQHRGRWEFALYVLRVSPNLS